MAAALAGLSGYLFGFGAAFVVLAITAAFSVVAALQIDPNEIDHSAARGAGAHDDGSGIASFAVLLQSRPLIVLGVTLTLFHLGNAAMLPLLGQALVAHGAGNASAFTGATIVIAQTTMVPVALFAAWLAKDRGYWLVFVLALVALPIRGATASFVTSAWGLGPVQILDGVGAGLGDEDLAAHRQLGREWLAGGVERAAVERHLALYRRDLDRRAEVNVLLGDVLRGQPVLRQGVRELGGPVGVK